MFDALRSAWACRCVWLMLLPPASDDPEAARPHSARLAVRDRQLARGADASMLHELSMGMSQISRWRSKRPPWCA